MIGIVLIKTHFVALRTFDPPATGDAHGPQTSVNHRSSAATGGGTGFLIREPFTQLPSLLPNFSSFEVSSLALKLPQSKVFFFNIYRPPSSSSFSKPFSCFLDEFTSFLSIAAPRLTNLLSPEISSYILTIPVTTSPPSFYLFYLRSTQP